MDILIISVLIFLGLIFLLAELFLLPGISIGGILSVVCFATVTYISFTNYGSGVGWLVIGISLVLSIIAFAISLRSKTWERLSLKSKIDTSAGTTPQSEVSIGTKGVTISRLSPMGKIEIGGKHFEAKSFSGYIDEHIEIEVVDFENFCAIVKRLA